MTNTMAIVAVALAVTCGAWATDVLEPLPPGAVKLSGGLAEPIAKSIALRAVHGSPSVDGERTLPRLCVVSRCVRWREGKRSRADGA